jgi:hypothetical protein
VFSRFASVSGRTVSRAEKIDGFLATARAAGLGRSAQVVERKARSPFGDSELPELGRAIAASIALHKSRPTGIVAMNDMLAIGIVARVFATPASRSRTRSLWSGWTIYLFPRLRARRSARSARPWPRWRR